MTAAAIFAQIEDSDTDASDGPIEEEAADDDDDDEDEDEKAEVE